MSIRLKSVFVALCALSGAAVHAAAGWGNCEPYAYPITTLSSASQYYEYPLQREWDPNAYVYDEQSQQMVQAGDWADANTSTTNGMGVFYYKLTVEKGKNYLVWTDPNKDCLVQVYRVKGNALRGFDSVVAADTGTTYSYLRAEDWLASDDDTCDYVIKLMTINERSKTKRLYCTNQAVADVVKNPGSKLTPIEMDLETPQAVTVARPTDGHPYVPELPVTYYVGTVLADVDYCFKVSASRSLPSGYYNFIDAVADGSSTLDIKTDWNVTTHVFTLRLRASATARLSFYVYAYEPDYTTLSWEYGSVEPLDYAGTYAALLRDSDYGVREAEISVSAVVGASGTNYQGKVTIDGVTYPLTWDGYALCGSTTMPGQSEPFEWWFDVDLKAENALSVDGCVVVPDVSGEPEDLFFAGVLGGSLMLKEESFLQFDAQAASKLSATQMGITGGAFVTEPAGSEALQRLWAWGGAKNVSIVSASTMTFGGGGKSGDPDGLQETAYLLDCIPEASFVEAEKKEFVITAFSTETGVVIAGKAHAGDRYGNGQVEVRSSLTPGGSFDTTPKSGDKVFYKAYLVK